MRHLDDFLILSNVFQHAQSIYGIILGSAPYRLVEEYQRFRET